MMTKREMMREMNVNPLKIVVFIILGLLLLLANPLYSATICNYEVNCLKVGDSNLAVCNPVADNVDVIFDYSDNTLNIQNDNYNGTYISQVELRFDNQPTMVFDTYIHSNGDNWREVILGSIPNVVLFNIVGLYGPDITTQFSGVITGNCDNCGGNGVPEPMTIGIVGLGIISIVIRLRMKA